MTTVKTRIRTLKDIKPAGPLQTQAKDGLEGLSVRAANCLLRMKPSLDTRRAVLAAMLAGGLHPENVDCLNLGWTSYREIRRWLGRELITREASWLLPVAVDRRDAEAVKRALARMATGDPPEVHSLKPLLLAITNAWERRGG